MTGWQMWGLIAACVVMYPIIGALIYRAYAWYEKEHGPIPRGTEPLSPKDDFAVYVWIWPIGLAFLLSTYITDGLKWVAGVKRS